MLRKVTTIRIPWNDPDGAVGSAGADYDIAVDTEGVVCLVRHDPPDAYGRPVAHAVNNEYLGSHHGSETTTAALIDYIASYHGEVLQLRAELDRLSAAVSRSES